MSIFDRPASYGQISFTSREESNEGSKAEHTNRFIETIRKNITVEGDRKDYGKWDSLPGEVRWFLIECAEHMQMLEGMAQRTANLEQRTANLEQRIKNLQESLTYNQDRGHVSDQNVPSVSRFSSECPLRDKVRRLLD
jgi:uncharacterized cupin superfamily protein